MNAIGALVAQLLIVVQIYNGHLPTAPPVEIVTPAELSQIACKDGCAAKAAYRGGVVYVSEQLNLNTPFGRSILFHELNHHQQRERGGDATTCEENLRRERAAYKAQNWYLEEVEHVGTRVMYMGHC